MPKMQPGLSLWALNNYLEKDGGVFDDIQLTERLDKDTCIDTIIEKWGTCDLITSDPRIVVRRTQLFFLKNYDNFDKMSEALQAEYNPIENYNRYEDTKEDRAGVENVDYQGSSGSSADSAGNSNASIGNNIGESNTEHLISAMNESGYQARNKDVNSARTDTQGTTSMDTEQSTVSTVDTSDTNRSNADNMVRESHIHGNIGITTSQQMILSSIELNKFNIYDYIADLYASEFLYRIW